MKTCRKTRQKAPSLWKKGIRFLGNGYQGNKKRVFLMKNRLKNELLT